MRVCFIWVLGELLIRSNQGITLYQGACVRKGYISGGESSRFGTHQCCICQWIMVRYTCYCVAALIG